MYFATAEEQRQFEQAVREMFGDTYRGVPVPPEYLIDWGKELTAALTWRKGVDAAIAASVATG